MRPLQKRNIGNTSGAEIAPGFSTYDINTIEKQTGDKFNTNPIELLKKLELNTKEKHQKYEWCST